MGKFYVDEKNQATIICNKCGLNKKLDVTKFKDTHKKLKAKCKCGEEFQLTLDFRRHYRKKVQLAGECFIQEKGERDDILIIDVSMSGVNFQLLSHTIFPYLLNIQKLTCRLILVKKRR